MSGPVGRWTELTLSFITSTNNHIPRISSLMHKLSRHYSEPCLELQSPDGTSTIYHTFPEPNRLPIDMEMTLRKLGFGYRAGFIESSLASLRAHFGTGPEDISHGLESWRTADLEQVREQLVALKGVGRKVADCVLLMCLDRVISDTVERLNMLMVQAIRDPHRHACCRNRGSTSGIPFQAPQQTHVQTALR